MARERGPYSFFNLPSRQSTVIMAKPLPTRGEDMPVPHIYKEFFHQVNQVESRVKLWAEDDYFKSRPLESMFHFRDPLIKEETSISFGEFISKADDIAHRYGLSVRPPQDSTKDVSISGIALYGMAINILDLASAQSRNLKQMEQLVPVIRDFVELIESLVSFDHPDPQLNNIESFSDMYMMNAKMGLRQVYDHLELFNEKQALAKAKKDHTKITRLFETLPGDVQDQMILFAIVLEGGEHGRQQANKLKALAEPDGPGI